MSEPAPDPGIFVRALVFLFGASWRTSVGGVLGALFAIAPQVAILLGWTSPAFMAVMLIASAVCVSAGLTQARDAKVSSEQQRVDPPAGAPMAPAPAHAQPPREIPE